MTENLPWPVALALFVILMVTLARMEYQDRKDPS